MKKINGTELHAAFQSGANAILNNRDRIDAMNVFPVPDGDTGSNMSSTITYAVKELKDTKTTEIGAIATKFARGMLMGARGNSGVILSQIFKGLAVGLKDKQDANAFDLVNAFGEAKNYAYNSVIKPVEGTILTVIRMIHEKLASTITPQSSVIDFFNIVITEGKAACLKTPDFLPVLKEVGVIDSGGEGLYVILEGMANYLNGHPTKLSNLQQKAIYSKQLVEEDFTGEFGYCTEFIVDLKNHRSFRRDKFQSALEKMGNSIVIVHDENLLKAHIHTKKPGSVLNFSQKFGEFIKIKSENMTLQANESQKAKASLTTSHTKPSPKPGEMIIKNGNQNVKIGVISCNVGSGIIKEMKELGADVIIEGGQSMNPSAKDFIESIAMINADKIVILPNNSNIILTAQQVTQTSKKEIVVIPTKTQMQGLVAMMNLNRDSPSLEELQDNLKEAIGDVKTGQVTTAVRDTKIGDVAIQKGEYLAIADREIIKSVDAKVAAAIVLCQKLIDEETELVTIYYGEDATQTDGDEIASFLETNYDVAIEVKNGNQPTYNFLMAFE